MNATSGYNDMTSYEFSHSGCSWCHPGGGSMEYDREGYRYDGADGLFLTGANPAPKAGDYFIFDPATKTIADPSTVINQGASTPQATTSPTTTVNYKTWAQGGVAEVDCLMCHLSNAGDARYSNLERAFAFPGATMPKLGASLGLVGAKGGTGLLTIASKATATANPNITPTLWSWATPSLAAEQIVKTPSRENCTICHFPDQSWWGNCGASNWPGYNAEGANCGPASKPFGATMFQKLMPVGAVVDGDIMALNSTNTSTWKIAKGRVEGGKRGESINGSGNPDAHMKTAGQGMSCVDCHYALSGDFPALVDSSGNVIQPPLTGVTTMDHQFAKGNNAPDGKNMDQLDNTATCASCHIDGTHPNAEGAPSPATAHAGFPAAHFEKIDCKTCHIPVVNGPVKQIVADFTAGPFQTFERTQTLEAPPGVNLKPLYMWRATEHDGTGLQIEPIMTMAVPVWASRVDNGDGTFSYNPTYQRAAKMAAEKYRSESGEDGSTGKYNFKLNTPVSYAGAIARTAYSSATGTTETFAAKGAAFAINTAAEVAGVADIFKNPAAHGMPEQFSAVAEPVISFYFNQFALSHNVAKKTDNKVLGDPDAGGCLMCHSSSDSASVKYSANSVGFFDKTFTLFDLPTDGFQQTSVDDVKKINIKFGYKKADGSSGTVDLGGVSDGANIGNTLAQGTILGYDAAKLQTLAHPKSGDCTPCHGSAIGTIQAVSMATLNHSTVSAATDACTDCHTNPGVSVSAQTVDVVCGQCHGGGTSSAFASYPSYTTTGAPYKTTAILEAMAKGMHMNNVAPSIGKGAVTKTGYTVSFTDESTDDNGTAGLKVTVNWGDGSVQTEDAGFAFSHTYTRARTYKIYHSVTDGSLSASEAWTESVPTKTDVTVTIAGATDGKKVSALLKQNGHTKKVARRTSDGDVVFSKVRPGDYTIKVYSYGKTFPVDTAVTVGNDGVVSFPSGTTVITAP